MARGLTYESVCQLRNNSTEQGPHSALGIGHAIGFMAVWSLKRMTRRSVVNLCFGNRAVSLLYGNFLRPFHTSICNPSSQPKAGFKPEKVAVVTKTTRYEFEQQRYRYAGLSEEDFKQLVRTAFHAPSQAKQTVV